MDVYVLSHVTYVREGEVVTGQYSARPFAVRASLESAFAAADAYETKLAEARRGWRQEMSPWMHDILSDGVIGEATEWWTREFIRPPAWPTEDQLGFTPMDILKIMRFPVIE